MRSIPRMINVSSDEDGEKGTFIYSPLAPGYGVTIGNSLRRVLLSSVPGCGIVSIYIEGVLHKFCTIGGMTEDVVHLIENLKGIRFKFLSEVTNQVKVKVDLAEIVSRLNIDTKVPSFALTSGMLNVPEDLNILNDVHICTVNPNTNLSFMFIVEKGIGYVDSVDNITPHLPHGFILVNNVLNAVKRAAFHVEKVRYGEYTDYESLTLEIVTDGSITPFQSLSNASTILLDNFRVINGNTNIDFLDKNSNFITSYIGSSGKKNQKDEILSKSIKDIGLHERVVEALMGNNIHTVKDLTESTEKGLLEIPKLGTKKISDIKHTLAHFNLFLKNELSQ